MDAPFLVHSYGWKSDFKVNMFFVLICLILKLRKLHGFKKDLSAYNDDNYLGHNNQDFR